MDAGVGRRIVGFLVAGCLNGACASDDGLPGSLGCTGGKVEVEGACRSLCKKGDDCEDGEYCDGRVCRACASGDACRCGDGRADGAEVCDGADLAGDDCEKHGFAGGVLTCNDTCDGVITSACTLCGNGKLDGLEACDGDELADETCHSVNAGFTGGQLACLPDCSFYDVRDCIGCGNGIREGSEACDGEDYGTSLVTCQTYGSWGGNLDCTSDCHVDHSDCCANRCDDSKCQGLGGCGCVFDQLLLSQPVSGSTAALNDSANSPCGGAGAADVAYGFTVPHDGAYRFDTSGSGFDTVVQLLNNDCYGDALGCNDDASAAVGGTSELLISLAADSGVVVVVDGKDGGEGNYQLVVSPCQSSQCLCTENDLGSDLGMVSGSLTGQVDLSEPSCSSAAREAPHRWTAPTAGAYTFHTSGTDFDTVVYVKDDCHGQELACNDNDGSGRGSSAVTLALAASESVFVYVSEAVAGAGESYQLTVDSCADHILDEDSETGETTTASHNHQPSLPPCQNKPVGGRDVSYLWIPTHSGRFYLNTLGSDFDTLLYVRADSCYGREIACNDNEGGKESGVVVDAVAGTSYVVIIDGVGATNKGNYVLNIVELPATWTCRGYDHGPDQACDCGCGADDPDCLDLGCDDPYCYRPICTACHDNAGRTWPCNTPAPPSGWDCGTAYDNGICDCGCGATDNDCAGAGCITPYCNQASCQTCRDEKGEPWPCGRPQPPSAWRCGSAYSDGQCDCGCLAADVDCPAEACLTPYCDDSGCQICHDLKAGVWSCGQQPPPVEWTCADNLHDNGTCDCGCGVADPDCPGGGCVEAYCEHLDCTSCHAAFGQAWPCGQPAPPAEWACPILKHGNGSCDCGCGAGDPDCAAAGCAEPYCHDAACLACHGHHGQDWVCGQSAPPPGWICQANLYDDGACDCGCATLDTDCSPDSCVNPFCSDTGCDRCHQDDGSNWNCGQQQPPSLWSCANLEYDDGTCHCGCTVADLDCAVDECPAGWRCPAAWYDAGNGCNLSCGIADPDCP